MPHPVESVAQEMPWRQRIIVAGLIAGNLLMLNACTDEAESNTHRESAQTAIASERAADAIVKDEQPIITGTRLKTKPPRPFRTHFDRSLYMTTDQESTLDIVARKNALRFMEAVTDPEVCSSELEDDYSYEDDDLYSYGYGSDLNDLYDPYNLSDPYNLYGEDYGYGNDDSDAGCQLVRTHDELGIRATGAYGYEMILAHSEDDKHDMVVYTSDHTGDPSTYDSLTLTNASRELPSMDSMTGVVNYLQDPNTHFENVYSGGFGTEFSITADQNHLSGDFRTKDRETAKMWHDSNLATYVIGYLKNS